VRQSPATDLRTLRLRNGTEVRIGPYWAVTVLPGGAEVHAHPRPDQAAIAAELGYPNAAALTREHDPLHSLLAAWLGLPASFAIREAAGDLPVAQHRLADLEEAAVLALQRFMRAAGVELENIE
jgi:hypothetical protein